MTGKEVLNDLKIAGLHWRLTVISIGRFVNATLPKRVLPWNDISIPQRRCRTALKSFLAQDWCKEMALEFCFKFRIKCVFRVPILLRPSRQGSCKFDAQSKAILAIGSGRKLYVQCICRLQPVDLLGRT